MPTLKKLKNKNNKKQKHRHRFHLQQRASPPSRSKTHRNPSGPVFTPTPPLPHPSFLLHPPLSSSLPTADQFGKPGAGCAGSWAHTTAHHGLTTGLVYTLYLHLYRPSTGTRHQVGAPYLQAAATCTCASGVCQFTCVGRSFFPPTPPSPSSSPPPSRPPTKALPRNPRTESAPSLSPSPALPPQHPHVGVTGPRCLVPP